MKSAKLPQSITMSLLTLGLLMVISPAEENRYGYAEKQPTGNQPAVTGTPAAAKTGFWQRFRKDLKRTGRQLGNALGRTRDELNYSFHNSTTKFPRNNNLNRHQKRFSGHVRTRNEAPSTPYRKPPASKQRKLTPSSPPAQSRSLGHTQNSTVPPSPPVEIIRPNKPPVTDLPPATKKQPVSKPSTKPRDTTSPLVEKNKEPVSAPLNSPATQQPAPLNVSPKQPAAEKKQEPKKKPDYPVALKTDNPGFVKSPYPPFALLDVRDIKPGGLAMEPDSDRIFRIPK